MKPLIPIQTSDQKEKRGLILLYSLFAGILLNFFVSTIFREIDPDTWFILNNGRYILENGFPETNPFVMHSDLPIVISQWALAVGEYFLYSHFGWKALTLLVALFTTLTAALIWLLVKNFGIADKRMSFAVTTVALLLISPFLTFRPSLLTIPVVALELLFLNRYDNTKNWKWLAGIPLCAFVIANIHLSLFAVVFLPLAAYMAPILYRELRDIKNALSESSGVFLRNIEENQYSILKQKDWKASIDTGKKELLPLLLCTLLSILSGACNPYGARGLLYLVFAFPIANYGRLICELQEPSLVCSSTAVFVLLITAVALSLYRKGTSFAKSWHWVLYVGGCFLYVMAVRNRWMFVLFSIPMIADMAPLFEKQAKAFRMKATTATLAIFFCVYIFTFLSAYQLVTNYGRIENTETTPTGAVYYLVDNSHENDTIFTGFNCGAYVQWNGLKTYMDARPELYGDIFVEYADVFSGKTSAYDLVEKYKFDYLLITDSDRHMKNLAPHMDAYEKVYEDEVGCVYRRREGL